MSISIAVISVVFKGGKLRVADFEQTCTRRPESY